MKSSKFSTKASSIFYHRYLGKMKHTDVICIRLWRVVQHSDAQGLRGPAVDVPGLNVDETKDDGWKPLRRLSRV